MEGHKTKQPPVVPRRQKTLAILSVWGRRRHLNVSQRSCRVCLLRAALANIKLMPAGLAGPLQLHGLRVVPSSLDSGRLSSVIFRVDSRSAQLPSASARSHAATRGY